MDKEKLKIGIALGSGGAKGLAHIGVLRVLEKYGIELDLISSSSMGAIIGAAYALGQNPDEMEELVKKFFVNSDVFAVHNFHFFHESLIRREDIREVLRAVVGDKNFSDLKIPLMALCMDLESGNEVRITEGPLLDAIEASSAIPAIFPPVFTGERYLVDGGLTNATPVGYLRNKNMDVVIGVHTDNMVSKQYIAGMIWEKYYKKPEELKKVKHGAIEQAEKNILLMVHILLRTIEVARRVNAKISFLAAHPDVVVKPYTADIGMLQFERIDDAIKAGEEAMEKQMPRLLKIIEQKKADKARD